MSYGAGVTLGCVLGSALAIYNGLLILHIPVATTFGLFWLRGIPLPHGFQVFAFGAALSAARAPEFYLPFGTVAARLLRVLHAVVVSHSLLLSQRAWRFSPFLSI